MTYPNIQFVNHAGDPFPLDEDDVPYIKQFKGRWYIQLDASWSGGVALEGQTLFPLTWDSDQQRWEPPSSLDGHIVRRSGKITAVLTNSQGVMLQDTPRQSLCIRPANITEQQMDKMIADIGIMALTTACCVKRLVPTPLGEGSGIESLGQQWAVGEGILTTATALLDLADVVKNSWADLEKRPLKSFIAEPGSVDINRASLSPHLLVRKLVNPSKRRIFGITRSESTQCSENEFICHVLDYYLCDLASGLADSLNSLTIEDISDKYVPKVNKKRNDREFKEFIEKSLRKIRNINSRSEELRQQISSVSKRLIDCVLWAKQARQTEFLKKVSTPLTPSLTSLRLTESPIYGPIYTKFSNVVGDALEPLQKIFYFMENIFQGNVKPTWEIYEIWCFAKLYSGFILHTTLKPDANESDLFQCLSLGKDGSILLPKERPFKLVSEIKNKAILEVFLTYEPSLKNQDGQKRTPDICIQIKVGSAQKNEVDRFDDDLIALSIGNLSVSSQIYNSIKKPRSYYLDAKYRDYYQQGYKVLAQDVIGTARDKYKNGLSADGSFILHSDTAVDYWGEVPFDRFFEEVTNEDSNINVGEFEWPGHGYGAISLLPGSHGDQQIRKILRLLLQYHDSRLAMTCINCGCELCIGRDAHTSWKPDRISEEELANRVLSSHEKSGSGTGIYCSCPKCGDFWVIQSCFGPHHRLLKFQDCFHRNSDHPEFKDKWMYICPECGSDPSLADLRQGQSLYNDIDVGGW